LMSSLVHMADIIPKSKSHQAALMALMSHHASLHGLRVKTLSSDPQLTSGFHYYDRNRTYIRQVINGTVTPTLFHMSWKTNKGDQVKFMEQMGLWHVTDQCRQRLQDEGPPKSSSDNNNNNNNTNNNNNSNSNESDNVSNNSARKRDTVVKREKKQAAVHKAAAPPTKSAAGASRKAKHSPPTTSSTMAEGAERPSTRSAIRKNKVGKALYTGIKDNKKVSKGKKNKNANETVVKVKMLTGTLYLYRGENPRAEFIRTV